MHGLGAVDNIGAEVIIGLEETDGLVGFEGMGKVVIPTEFEGIGESEGTQLIPPIQPKIGVISEPLIVAETEADGLITVVPPRPR